MLAATMAGIMGFMSFLGFGQMYVGKFLRGGLLLGAGLLIRLLTLGDSDRAFSAEVRTLLPPFPWWFSTGLRLVFATLWLWSVFDAYRQAKQFNAARGSSGTE
jgi:hypothetical protein